MSQNNEQGYSLLEVMLALVLAGVGTAFMALSYQQAAHLQRLLEGRIVAEVLGSSKLAELEAGSELVSSGEFAPPYQQYTWSTQLDETQQGLPIVDLTVEWSGGYRDKHQKVLKGFPARE